MNSTTTTTTTTTATTRYYNCRILYSTQSGRAKACARRVARIIASYNNNNNNNNNNSNNNNNNSSNSSDDPTGGGSSTKSNNIVRLLNGNGTTFDDEIGSKTSIVEWAKSLEVVQQEEQEHEETEKSLLLLFVSTTGDGEQTDTIQQTWKQLLQRSIPNTIFSNTIIGLFCLGDRAYGTQFCAAGRKVGTRFLQLGAQLLCDIGYGDDNTPAGGVFADLDNWIYTILVPKLVLLDTTTMSTIGTTTSVQPTNTTTNNNNFIINEPPYKVRVINSSSKEEDNTAVNKIHTESYNEFFKQQCPVTAYRYVHNNNTSNGSTTRRQPALSSSSISSSLSEFSPLLGTIVTNEKLIKHNNNNNNTSNGDNQDTRHFRIDVSMQSSADEKNFDVDTTSKIISINTTNYTQQQQLSYQDLLETQLPYRAGDVASILPVISTDEVNRFIAVLPPSIQAIVDNDIEITYSPPSSSVRNNGNNDNSTPSYFYPGVCYPYWPKRCTIRGLITYCANICALPEREDLRTLGYYCCSNDYHTMAKDQQDKLIALSETSASALYVDYIIREKRMWADVLYDFDTLRHEKSKLTIEVLLALLSPIRIRDYSIASSPFENYVLCQPKQPPPPTADEPTNQPTTSTTTKQPFTSIELCVAVVRETTPLGRSYNGLCTNYLANIEPTTTTKGITDRTNFSINPSIVRLWIRPGSFHSLPYESKDNVNDDDNISLFQHPILCIGAGTGVAPLRALIRERKALYDSVTKKNVTTDDITNNGGDRIVHTKITSTVSVNECDNILLFGCRSENVDYYYKEEWMEMESKRILVLLTAFSRDQSYKTYVQHILQNEEDDSNFIVEFLVQRKGCIYIAGNPNMAKAVKETLVDIIKVATNNDEQKAIQFVNQLQRKGQFAVEAWS